MMVFDRSHKEIIGGPITIEDDEPATKYRAESDGRTFWAYNGMEVFYEDERMYGALDLIDELQARLNYIGDPQNASDLLDHKKQYKEWSESDAVNEVDFRDFYIGKLTKALSQGAERIEFERNLTFKYEKLSAELQSRIDELQAKIERSTGR